MDWMKYTISAGFRALKNLSSMAMTIAACDEIGDHCQRRRASDEPLFLTRTRTDQTGTGRGSAIGPLRKCGNHCDELILVDTQRCFVDRRFRLTRVKPDDGPKLAPVLPGLEEVTHSCKRVAALLQAHDRFESFAV